MSAPSSWLVKQRKPELVELAEQVGLKDYENLKKSDLESALDEHLRANQAKLSRESKLEAFFKRIRDPSGGSPTKKEQAVAVLSGDEPKPKPKARRQTKAKEELEKTDVTEGEPSNALVPRTPRTSISFGRNLTLPPSPSQLADQIDQQTANIRSSISKTWQKTGISAYTQQTRDMLSSIVTIELLAITVEVFGLEGTILPILKLAGIPASKTLGTPPIFIKIPDVFTMLTPGFWGPFSLWLTTSLLLPLVFAYFFNLTLKAKHGHVKHAKSVPPTSQYDPLSYHISKALIAWTVYSQGFRFGGFLTDQSVALIDRALPGGYACILVGSGIGVLVSIYDAVLKK
ncbi:hypothetical protein MMC09_006516 [Bachmanniomyces sp. S44760]|nr:hypothetical protein [Bachmanniomyces sp. S44760]